MKRMASLILALTLVLVTLLPLTAVAEDKIVIGVSEPSLGWPYIAAYAEKFTAQLPDHAGVEAIVLSADGDIEKQTNDINDLIVQDVDIILVCSLDGDAVIPALAQASAAGIPVLAISNEPGEGGKQYLKAYAGPDDYVEGQIAAELMLKALGYEGGTQEAINIIIIEGAAGQSTTQLRRQAWEDYMAKNAPNATVLDSQPCDWDSTKEISAMQAFLTKYGTQINGVFAEGNAAATAEVVAEAGYTIPVVGVGLMQAEKDAITKGILYGVVTQSATADAKLGLETAIAIVKGEMNTDTYNRYIIDMPVATSENIAQTEVDY